MRLQSIENIVDLNAYPRKLTGISQIPTFFSLGRKREPRTKDTFSKSGSGLDQRGPGGRLATRAREDASQAIAGDLRDRGRWDRSARLSSVCA